MLRSILSIFLLMSAVLRANPAISEFMASNKTTIRDGDGEYPDWVEIWNQGSATLNLQGWRLTDSASKPSKFVFPSLEIGAGQRVVVFCSDRAGSTGAATYVDSLGYIHTNFSLSASGEYLALLSPAGVKTSEFAPTFPVQAGDMSYGIVQPSGTLVGTGSSVKYAVPTGSSYDTAQPPWTSNAFSDTAWTSATGSGLGFESGFPIGYWPLDDSAGSATAVDASGAGHTGILAGSATLGLEGCSEQTATAAGFSTSSGKIAVPYDAALNPSTFTIAAWARPDAATGDYQGIVSSRQNSPAKGYTIYISNSNRWEFFVGRANGSWRVLDGGPVTFGTWSHVAATCDGSGDLRFYIGGILKASYNGSSFSSNTTYPLHIGAGGQDGSQYRFDGRIDDVTFWNYALGAPLILQHRDSTGGSFPTPLYSAHYQTNVQIPLETANPGLYARYSFAVADPAELGSLGLRMKFDDAFVAYLNGSEVARGNFTGTRAYGSVADSDREDSDAVVWQEHDITTSGLPLLVPGQNTLAIHTMRRSLSGQQFLSVPELVTSYIDPSVSGYFATATPAAANSGFTSPGPAISGVSHTPKQPLPSETVTVTVRVTPRLGPVQSVTLTPRVGYNAEGAAIAMADNGLAPDATDGTRIFTAALPNAGGASARQMLRYRITATDTAGRIWNSPFVTDTTDDDGKSQSPQYHGTVVMDAGLAGGMPVLQWFTQDVANSDTRTGSRACCFYQGDFYDNIYVRQRGGYTSWGSQKFNFNRGHGLHVDDELGSVGEVNMNSAGSDSTYLRPVLAFDIWRYSGHPACNAQMVAMYRNGSFHRMSSMIEQVDEDFLSRHDLDFTGALYKFVQRPSLTPALGDTTEGVEKKTRLNENLADLDAFVAGIGQTDPDARNAYLFNSLNIPNFVNFMALRNLTGEADTNRKNFYMHRDTNHSGEWRLFPWDKDFTFGVQYNSNIANPWQATQTYYHDPGNSNQWCVLFQAGLDSPHIRAMVARRIRNLADSALGPPGTAYGSTVFESRLEAVRAPMLPLPPGASGGSSYNDRTSIDSWLITHREQAYNSYGPDSAYKFVAAAASPLPMIRISSADPHPSAGTQQDLEFIKLENNGAEEVDISGWTLWNPGKSKPFFTFAPGTVVPAAALAPLNEPYVVRDLPAFRSRAGAGPLEFVLGEYDGQISARGETIELRDGPLAASRLVSSFSTPVTPTPAQQFLRVSELMFAPLAPTPAELAVAPGAEASDYEYLELVNIGSSSLDLSGCAFTDGIDFTFPAGTSLPPAGRLVIASNSAAYGARYPTATPPFGAYSGNLDNSGEHLRLEDATGETVLDFSYHPEWFTPYQTLGRPIVTRSATPDYSAYDKAATWTLGGTVGGTPGTPETSAVFSYQTWMWGAFGEAQVLLPSPPHPEWTLNSTLVGPGADPDGDGRPNLLEYALGGDPNKADQVPGSLAFAHTPDGTFTCVVTRRAGTLDTLIEPEASTDSTMWNIPMMRDGESAPLPGGMEAVTYHTFFTSLPDRLFVRLRVTLP